MPSIVLSQFLPFVALTRFRGVCFRSQRLRLARLTGEFLDGFLTVAVTAIFYWLRSLLSSVIQLLRYRRLMAPPAPATRLHRSTWRHHIPLFDQVAVPI